MALFHLAYVSAATELFSDAELLSLLERSRSNNQPAGITGLLLYRDGDFMQLLEGEELAVRETHARILRDPRHRGAITLLQAPLAARAFSEWSMAFRKLGSEDAAGIPGYSDYLNENWFGRNMTENPSRALQMLQFFRSRLR